MPAIGFAFAVGYALTLLPMLRTMPFKQAAKVTVMGDTDGCSILAWVGAILLADFAVSYLVMHLAIKREQNNKGMMI